jgi:hypothetical protein
MSSSQVWKKRIVIFTVGVLAGLLTWFSVRAEGNLTRHQHELAPISQLQGAANTAAV